MPYPCTLTNPNLIKVFVWFRANVTASNQLAIIVATMEVIPCSLGDFALQWIHFQIQDVQV